MPALRVRRLLTLVLLAAAALFTTTAAAAAPGEQPTAVIGVSLPEGYRDGTAVAPSHRTDRGHIRMMLANPITARAHREGTVPLPDGTPIGDAARYRTCFPRHEANGVDHDDIFTRWAP